MSANGWIQIGLFCLAILVCVKPLGRPHGARNRKTALGATHFHQP